MNLRHLLAGALALGLSSAHVYAQSAPGWVTGYKPTAAQWNAAFAAKQDVFGAGSIGASLLASGAAAANLSTMLPNLSASVQGTGVPGLDGAHWRLYNGFSTWDPTPTVRVDRYVSGAQTGTYAGGPYYAGFFQTTTGVNEVAYEWPLFSQVINYTNASTAAQHVAVGGYMLRNPPLNTVATTGASGGGTTATVTFAGGATIPVGHSVKIAGVTPSGYNGNWKITASSAGSVSFLNATTGAQTVAGTVVDISLAPGWGANFVCTDQAGEPDPITGCLAMELDSYTNYSGTDANKSRVTLQMMAGTGHISRGILQGTKGGGVYDRAYELDGSIGIGFDVTNATFTGPAFMLTNNQQIAFDGNATTGAYARYLAYNGSSLIYQVPGGTAFGIGDGGTVSASKIASFSGADLQLTAAAGNKLQLGVNGVASVYTLDTGGLYPENDNLRTLGTSALRFSTIYGTGLGASSFPFTNAYITNETLGAAPTWPSQTANTFWAAPNGSSGAPTMRAIVAADLPATLTSGTIAPSSTIALNPGTGGTLQFGANAATNIWQLTGGGTFMPSADNTRSFGATTNRIANIYANQYYAGANVVGVSCTAGTVNVTTMVVTNGIVTHC